LVIDFWRKEGTMNKQTQLQLRRSGTTILLIGGVTLLIGNLIFLLLVFRGAPYPSAGMKVIITLTIPLQVQGAILLVLSGGWLFVRGLSLLRSLDKSLLLISTFPLCAGFLTYLLPQTVADGSNWYPAIETAYHAALLVAKLLFVVGSLHIVIGVVAWILGAAYRPVTKLAHRVD
jgi:hypothetical protein